jgi:hypothetical protein
VLKLKEKMCLKVEYKHMLEQQMSLENNQANFKKKKRLSQICGEKRCPNCGND